MLNLKRIKAKRKNGLKTRYLDTKKLKSTFIAQFIKRHFFIFCMFSMLLFFAKQSQSAFRDSYLGAKSMAMGGSYTALANDVDGILANPAGINDINAQQLIATTAILHVGLSDESRLSQNILGYAYKPREIDALGILWKQFNASNLYRENIFALSYARKASLYLSKSEQKRPRNLSLGGTIKVMNWDSAPTVDAYGRTVEDLSGWTGVDFDLGVIIWISENTPVAVSFQNLRSPNIASNSSNIKEYLPSATRMGVAAIEKNFTWVLDLILKKGEIDLKIGGERKSHDNRLYYRAGMELANLAWGMNFTAGIGYKPSDSMRIDYAFVYPINTILDTFGSHRVSIVYDFGE